VPKQDPYQIESLLRNYIQSVTPGCVKVSLKKYASSKPVFIGASNIYIKSAWKAYENVFNKKPIFQGSGGTIPIVNLLYEDLSMPVILMGFALPDDSPHGPNEKFSITNFFKGIATSINFMQVLGQLNKKM
jgi:acetylornithine deacetylase/succinyl-diaminopimelate desuccinylase-like protein